MTADLQSRLAGIQGDLTILKGMIGFNIALTAAALALLLRSIAT
jgi:hypothetical protein